MWDWLDAIKLWIESLPARALDLVLSPAASFISSLPAIHNTPASFFVGFCTDLLQLCTLIAIPQCLVIIAAAYPIRFLLQLIPFVRLGS